MGCYKISLGCYGFYKILVLATDITWIIDLTIIGIMGCYKIVYEF